jgi:hypothetical protein
VELGPKQSIVFKELKPEVLHKIQPNNFILFYFILFTGEISPISEITN